MTTLDQIGTWAAVPCRVHDFLRVRDLDAYALAQLLDLATALKADPSVHGRALEGDSIACIFEKPSTRTRVSFAAAAARLGAQPIALRPDELQIGRGEPLADTARSLAGYVSAIVIRTFAQATVDELARWSSVPVVNALSDEHHPCQALADLLTIRELVGDLAGTRVAFVGDGWDVHAVYADVWASMGEEEERETRRAALAPYQVTSELMRLARHDAMFLHCLPAKRGEEVTAEVIDGPQSAVWRQSANRMPTEAALLLTLVTHNEAATSHPGS
jgi:ornithine carbamoyltransferase